MDERVLSSVQRRYAHASAADEFWRWWRGWGYAANATVYASASAWNFWSDWWEQRHDGHADEGGS